MKGSVQPAPTTITLADILMYINAKKVREEKVYGRKCG